MEALPTPAPLRTAILDAARTLLLDEGYAALSMRKIAQRIGYSPTALYLHFAHKDAILHALLEEGMDLLRAAFDRALAEAPADGPGRLRALCEAYVRFGQANPARYEVMFLLHPRHMERYPPEKYREARRNLDPFVVALGGDPAEPDGPTRVAATGVWAQLHGAVALLLAGRLDARLDPEAVVGAVVESVVRGAMADAPHP